MEHSPHDLIHLFNETFFDTYDTKLVYGGEEPIYLPKNDEIPYHQIIFAHGYFASALHEISHWCIAGQERRQLEDFGYWYCPDGRDQKTQEAFQVVELKPQALDWLFCLATHYPFNVSCDNLNGTFEPDRQGFKKAVAETVVTMLKEDAIPPRAKTFLSVLNHFYNTEEITVDRFLHHIK